MRGYFPYFAAAAVTATVGAVASFVWAAQVPAVHVVAPPAGMHASPPIAHVANVAPNAALPGNAVNTPTTTPVQPGQAFVTPGFGVAQQVGTGGVPGVPSFTEGFGTTSAFSATGMNQPGQAPFPEALYGNQGVGSTMDTPGQPNFYDGFGFNRGVVPPNQGAQPLTPYPNSTIQVQPVNATATAAVTTVTTPTVGFYNGFGAGQPDVGFYAGFTTPR